MRRRVLGPVGTLLVLLAGCGVGPPQPTSAESRAPASAPASTRSPTPASPTPVAPGRTARRSGNLPVGPTGAKDRPLLPIPDVKPQGFVPPPPGVGLNRYAAQKFRWRPCHADEQCTTVEVPLDYAHPDGQAITLALARKRSTAAESKGTLFINPGGPGGSGVDFVRQFRDQDLRDYDIIGWDPRGVGASTPVECFGGDQLRAYTELDASPDNARERRALELANQAFGRSCLERSGALLEHVSTEETVRDLDLLRQIAGSARLDYFGFSYGTAIGARYAQLFPRKVGRMVLDGAVSLAPGGRTSTGGRGARGDQVSQAEGFDRSLNDFAAWAARHGSRLGSSKGAVLRAITGFYDRLDARPLPVGPRELTESLAVTGTTLLLYENASYYRYLEAAFEQAIIAANGSALLSYADQYNRRSKDGSYGQLNDAFPAIRCLDDADSGIAGALADWKAEEKQAPTFARYLGPDFSCPTWPVRARVDHDGSPTAPGAPPIVVIGTTRDPATPYEYAQAMARQLSSAVLVTLRGEGHTAYDQSACIRSKIDPYLLRGEVPRDGTTCPS